MERLQAASPDLVNSLCATVRTRITKSSRKWSAKLGRRPAGDHPRERLFEHLPTTHRLNLHRCQEFLEELRTREHHLREAQLKSTQDLLQIQAARRVFEETLKEMLRTERQPLPADDAELYATENEVVAGLQELKEHGGQELHQFIGELEQVLHQRERNGK